MQRAPGRQDILPAFIHWSHVAPWVPWARTPFWVSAQPEPAPEPEPERPTVEIPEPIRTGDAPFYVLVLSDDNPRGSEGEPIVLEHPMPNSTTLRAVLQKQAQLNGRYGTSHIAECRIIPELTREVQTDA